ncbi:hypothetical protein [Radiobacillus sp. PE A8.2]|uniref:hypothetical protein n=1 Tax=Radiobacillus sp. PE A8.2 TaxID=3380349 RepID=UPI00388D5C86
MRKSPLLAFFLALIPGFGHMYLGRKVRGFLYALSFFGSIGLGFIALVTFYEGDIALIFLILAALIWGISVLDMLVILLSGSTINGVSNNTQVQIDDGRTNSTDQNERFFTILLSFVPGVGHFHLGLNQRGLTFLAGFIGLGTMVFFVSIMTNQGGFLIFLLALPIIWIYSLFDVIQLLNKKQNGETVEDSTIMDDLDRFREEGKKSKMLATILSMFPGAGHMYLGLQKRGLQLMIAFLLSIYVLDVLRLSIFLFLIPIIWFFSFFDALQQVNRAEYEELEDIPIVSYFVNHQKWVGIGLVVLGLFYLLDSIVLPMTASYFDFNIWAYEQYFQVVIVCLLLIGGGVKLLSGSSRNEEAKK